MKGETLRLLICSQTLTWTPVSKVKAGVFQPGVMGKQLFFELAISYEFVQCELYERMIFRQKYA